MSDGYSWVKSWSGTFGVNINMVVVDSQYFLLNFFLGVFDQHWGVISVYSKGVSPLCLNACEMTPFKFASAW